MFRVRGIREVVREWWNPVLVTQSPHRADGVWERATCVTWPWPPSVRGASRSVAWSTRCS